MCIKVSCKLGMLVAITPGIDSKGPRASKTKPKYHTLGLKRKIKKRIAASLASLSTEKQTPKHSMYGILTYIGGGFRGL